MAPAAASASPRVELDLSASCTTEDELAQLDALRSENQLLRRFLQRVAPESLLAPPKATGALLSYEKAEICSQVAEHTARDIEECSTAGEAEQAHLAAAIAECRLRCAETEREAHELLKLLGLPEWDGSSGGVAGPTAEGVAAAPAQLPVVTPAQQLLRLPSASQLAHAAVPGERLIAYLEDHLRRRDTSAERLRLRGGVLKAHLAKLEHSLAAKQDMGGSLQQVDYDALQIQHAQAQARLETHSSESVQLKGDTGRAVQALTDIRASLAATAAAMGDLQRRTAAAVRQLEGVGASLAGVQGECGALERECEGLRRQRERLAGEDGSSILDYIKLKSAVTEAEKRVTDLRRKVEVAGSAGAGGGTWNSRRRQ